MHMFKIRSYLCSAVVRCPHLTEPENGNKSITGYMVGSTATFWCFPQYEMLCNNCELRVCEESGTWSGSAAVCAEKIGRYLILKTGVYNRNIMKEICSNN